MYTTGMSINKDTKKKAISLRKSGKSYGEILKILNLKSKGTLSAWFKDIELTKSEKIRLKDNLDLAQKRGLLEFNKKRTHRIKTENSQTQKIAKTKIGKPSNYDLLLVGVALYWGEGSKANIERYGYIDVANSDPDLIRVYMNFLRNTLNVNDSKIRPVIHVHENLNPKTAINFWSKTINLPKEKFGIYTAKSIASGNKRSINRLPYGTLRVRVNSRKLVYTIKGYLEAMAEKFSN